LIFFTEEWIYGTLNSKELLLRSSSLEKRRRRRQIRPDEKLRIKDLQLEELLKE